MRLVTIAAIALTVAAAFVLPQAARADLNFDYVTNWVGTGSNQAGLLIDWNDGKGQEWQAWGYRWDSGSPTTLDMIKAVTGSWTTVDWLDGSIQIGSGSGADADVATVFRKHSTWGHAVDSFAFDLDGDDAAMDGSDAGDHFNAGFEIGASGYWSFYIRPDSGGAWGYAPTGPETTSLADEQWYGFSWAADFVDTAPTPEPATLALLAIGGAGLLWRRTRRTRTN